MLFWKGLRFFVSRSAVILLLGVMLFSGYALWSDYQTYRDAENVYDELLALKPVPGGEDDGTTNLTTAFEALREVNPDICAWLTVEGTKIDYPVVQGTDNSYYMSRDVYKAFSLTGSIFLDSRNKDDFSEPYLIIYGHHVDKGLMFGDLDKFTEKEFFEEERQTSVITPDGPVEYRVLAVMTASDSVQEIFSLNGDFDAAARYDYISGHSLWTSPDVMELYAEDPSRAQVVALVTCTDGPTGTRLVVFLFRQLEKSIDEPDDPDNPDNPPDNPDNPPDNPDNPDVPDTGDSRVDSPIPGCIVACFASFLILNYLSGKKRLYLPERR